MLSRKGLNMAVIVATLIASFAVSRPSLLAAAPGNDSFASPTIIGGLPFSDAVDITEATTEPDEQQWCNFVPNTAWYAFTPTSNAVVQLNLAGSSRFDTHFNVYRAFGPGFFGLSFMGCNSFGSSTTLSVEAGVTYYIQAGFIFCSVPACDGVLQLSLSEVPPPANDDFANAVTVPSLPFSNNVDFTNATLEAGEPQASCNPDAQSKTAWYSFTPAASGSVMASIPSASSSTMLAAYVGSGLSDLTEVDCGSFGGTVVFDAVAGTTYYFQVAGLFGGIGTLQFQVLVTPLPVASFGLSNGSPSRLDTIQFFDFSFDPAGVGIQSNAWDFGDGATATGCCPTHRYASDGDYTVQLTITTFDGRTASTTLLLQVRTHDVSITKFQVPSSASAGQTRSIVVGIRNPYQPESVRVELYRSTANGFELIGFLDQFVPVRSSNRTTDFQFSYTFTANDAALGKVNFKARAILLGVGDALPADNEAISLPTRVGR